MLKTYAGDKILQIMKKIIAGFPSVASSIYHCFFFLDLCLLMSGPSLALGSLFKTTRGPQSRADPSSC